jgi:DNA-binding CsgD family transcriptional regulator
MAAEARIRKTVMAVERVCDEARDADELLAGLSEEVHRAVPHTASTWFGVDPVTLLATAPSRVEALEPRFCDTFWHLEFHEQDVGLFADLSRSEGATALRLALDDRPGRSVRYREFLQPQGYGDELRGVFRTGEQTWGFVGLYREADAQPFDRDDLAIVRAMSGVVGAALRIHVRNTIPWLGEPSGPGLLVIDREGRAVSANSEAICWLRDLWPESPGSAPLDTRSLEAFGLCAQALQVPTALFALVARARAVADGRERTPARLRARDRKGRWVVLHASVLSGPAVPGGEAVAVVIEAAKSAEIAPIIIEAYSLTSRERDVLGAIARGDSTAEIAAALFLSPHTVRDYVKTVFEKFGVSSRGELVARLYGDHYADRLHATMIDLH